ncbi:hypothetical protein J5N58_01190 [Rhizobium cremeum]|uniref:BRO-N domain-containing protein n=1 Tax=Rhizobium cremeum TaxID=2813827 RepID=UPI001FD5DA04|nr:BRO family protein [Rhizobium cremeum]MCJ7993211.1 hypothetical protein [Rhizobium cremeum]MCJ7998276.1 hypothetical protein [Rhizobium cremeum]
MNAIQNFAFEEHLVRVVEENGDPWFVATDVAKALNFRDAANAIRSVPDDEKGTRKVSTLGGEQSLLCVSEPGLFRLIFRSNKPEAERFQRFVFHEVLPQIRRTGRYDPAANRPAPPDAFEIDVQHAPLSAKVEYLRMVAKFRGREAAVAMMPHIGLPDVDLVLAGARISPDGRQCIDHALAHRFDHGQSVRELITQALARGTTIDRFLRTVGIRTVPEGEPGIAIAVNPRVVAELFAGTRWDNGGHVASLRGLDGVTNFGNPQKFDGIATRMLFIPSRWLSTDPVPGAA